MSSLTFLLLRVAFLALLWVFVFAVIYALRTDLFGQRARRVTPETPNPLYVDAPATAPQAVLPTPSLQTEAFSLISADAQTGGTSKDARQLVITEVPKKGHEVLLGREPITIGRSSDSGLVIRDDYTSTHHARLMLWSDDWVIHDLDSTNGTFLNGIRVTLPTAVPLNTPVRIGTTSFELRR